MKNPQKKRPAHRLLSSFVVAGFSSAALGNPTGATIAAGNATVSAVGSDVTVTSDGRAIINWNSFSIGPGELTRFVMSGADRAVLNRVTGGLLSQIDGRLEANGRVYLINPNGVVIGANGIVQTQSFIASTRGIADEDFMDGGTLGFAGTGFGEVHNLGTIEASDGDVALIGERVVNSGSITASQGVVALAAGDQVMLAAPGSERLLVLVSGAANGPHVSIDHTGLLNAAQVELQSVGGHMYGLAVNAGGEINATGIANRDGRIYLTADVGLVNVPGTLTASNNDGSGGTIHIDTGVGFGSEVNVTGTLDASSASTGGMVSMASSRIELNNGARVAVSGGSGNAGGVFIGSAENTDYLFIAEDTAIEANSLAGDAGNVDLSGAGVYFHGQLQARGAGTPTTFNINAGEAVAYSGFADLRPYGDDTRFGSVNVEVADANLRIETSSILVGYINADALDAQLDYANVRIAATGEGRYIDLFAPISWDSATRLSLVADDSVDVNQSIQANNGALHLSSLNGTVSDQEPATIAVRDLWLSAARNVSLANRVVAQNVTLYYVGGQTWLTHEANQLGTVTFARDLRTQGGEVDIVDSVGGLRLTTSNVGGLAYSTDGDFRVRTVGDLTLDSAFQAQVAGDVTLVASGGVLRNRSTAGANVFGTSSSGLGRTRVYAAGAGEHGGLQGPSTYNVSYSREHADAANTGFYYSVNAPQGPNPFDPNPVDPGPVSPNPPQIPNVPSLPAPPPSQIIQNALDGNSFEQLNRARQGELARYNNLQALLTPPPLTGPSSFSMTDTSDMEEFARLAGLALQPDSKKPPKDSDSGTAKDPTSGVDPIQDSLKTPLKSPTQQTANEIDSFLQQLSTYIKGLHSAGIKDPQQASVHIAQMLAKLSPETMQLMLKNQLDQLPELMAILMAQYAMEQRESALDAREAARDRAREQAEQVRHAADELRDAAANRLVAAIVQGAFQIAGGLHSVGSGMANKPPMNLPKPASQPQPDSRLPTPQTPVVTPPVSLPSAVQARLDAQAEMIRSLQNQVRP